MTDAVRAWCSSCALARWDKAGDGGTCTASTREQRKPRWVELNMTGPALDRKQPYDDCWMWEPIRAAD